MVNSTYRHKTRWILTAMLITTLLSACGAKIDEQSHQLQVQNFINEAQLADELTGKNERDWWQKLRSDQLNQLVADALNNNHDLKTSQLRLQSSLARLRAQRADFLPQGGAHISATQDGLADSDIRSSRANIGLSWQLDLFGRISALVDAAGASTMSQSEQLRLLQIEVVSSVVKGFVSYQGNVQKKQIIELQIEALQQSIEVLQARVDEGVANELDLNRTLAQLSQQQTLLPEIDYARFSDLSTLALLTGRLTSDLTLIDEQKVFQTPFEVSLENPNKAIGLRPDISRALYDFSRESSLSLATSRALMPEISLSAFAGVLSLGDYRLASAQKQWQVMPQIEWSLLSYPQLLAERDAQELLSKASYSEYNQVVLNAISESERSLQLLIKQNEQQQFADKRYKYANNAFLQAEAMYEEGQIPYLELLDARQDVLIAQENAIDSTIATLLVKVNTYQAFNGYWSYVLAQKLPEETGSSLL